MAHKGAQPGDWQEQPFPQERARLMIDRTFSTDEMRLMFEGLMPEEMEDKWFIVFDEDKDCTLRFYRSWTGYCIFVMNLHPGDRDIWVPEVWVNRNPEQYRETGDEVDKATLMWLIDTQLLENWDVALPWNDPLVAWAVGGQASLGPEYVEAMRRQRYKVHPRVEPH